MNATTTSPSFSNSNTYHYQTNHKRPTTCFLGTLTFTNSSSYYYITSRCTDTNRAQNNRHNQNNFLLVPKATASQTGKDNKNKNKKNKTKSNKKLVQDENAVPANENETEPVKLEQQQQQQQQPSVSISLDDVNPVGLGRKSRQLFDEVWRKFSGLGQISSTTRADDRDALDALLIREGPMCEFAIPGAQNTTVLVVGATSRIGRIVVRKLMLRGYTVKVCLFISFLTAFFYFDISAYSFAFC